MIFDPQHARPLMTWTGSAHTMMLVALEIGFLHPYLHAIRRVTIAGAIAISLPMYVLPVRLEYCCSTQTKGSPIAGKEGGV